MKIWIINEKEELINIGNAEKIYREKRYIVRVKGKEQVVISESEKEEEAKEKFDIILRGISKIVNSNEYAGVMIDLRKKNEKEEI